MNKLNWAKMNAMPDPSIIKSSYLVSRYSGDVEWTDYYYYNPSAFTFYHKEVNDRTGETFWSFASIEN